MAKRGRKKGVKVVSKKSEIDPTLAYARRLRQNLRARVKNRGMDPTDVPTAVELYHWLKSEEPLTCYYSGNKVTLSVLNVDHKEPLGLGGSSAISNLCVTTSRMNKAKGAFTEGEFRDILIFCKKWPLGGKYLFSRLLKGFMVGRKN